MPRTAKANPKALSRKSGSELMEESGELHDPVIVSQKTVHDKSSLEFSSLTQAIRLAAPSANDEHQRDGTRP